jgi:hypothetical protein
MHLSWVIRGQNVLDTGREGPEVKWQHGVLSHDPAARVEDGAAGVA